MEKPKKQNNTQWQKTFKTKTKLPHQEQLQKKNKKSKLLNVMLANSQSGNK